jgi:dihydroflavonol-4-reductase
MKALVTGATGFVGGHVARALVERGARVRCLARAESRLDTLEGLPIDVVRGDLADARAVSAAVAGCELVFHCAADYRLYVPDPAAMFTANVTGTENVLRAAAEHGVRRTVYTSTVGTLRLPQPGQVADERMPGDLAAMSGPYKKSKFLAERVAEAWAARGLAVVIVNPSAPVGEGDVKPTATGQMIVDFLAGRLAATVDTGLNLVDVRDVAVGHLLAAELGRVGERYILGHENLTLEQILGKLAAITGRPAPRLRLPHWVPLTVAALDTWRARLFGGSPRIALDAVRLSRHRMFFDAGKAVRELGLPQTPVDDALRRAVEWFDRRGYAKRKAA